MIPVLLLNTIYRGGTRDSGRLNDLLKVTDELSGPNIDLSPEYKFLLLHTVFAIFLSASLCYLNQWQKFSIKKSNISGRKLGSVKNHESS